jgi:general secretion pathway protein A
MYLSYYGLKKQPFHITPDPEFLYLSPSHKEALAAIIYGIEERKGFVTITGAVGVGKTTILRSYLESAEKKHLKIIYIFNAKLTFEELLKTICRELNLPFEGNDVVEMVNRLYESLIEEYKQGNTVVLVVDEAQNMPVDTLESLRMISNLETSRDKLIQIVLVGQPEFEDELNLDRLRQLKQRLAVRSTILPLTKEESFEYVKFRLQKAGSPSSSVFTSPALKKIIGKANGIPRVLNVLCDNALITGFGYQKKPVTKAIVKEIIGDIEGKGRPNFVRRYFRRVAGSLALLLLLLGIAWLLPLKRVWFDRTATVAPREQAAKVETAREVKPVDNTVAKAPEAPAGKKPEALPQKNEQPAVAKAPVVVAKPPAVADPLPQKVVGAEPPKGTADKKPATEAAAEHSLLRDKNGKVRGLWLPDSAGAKDRRSITAFLTEHGLPTTLLRHGYRVVPNKHDNTGGFFVMFGSARAPGEAPAPVQDDAQARREPARINPEYASTHYNTGLASYNKGQLDDAIQSYREAVRINPDHANARVNLGVALYKKGLLDDAIQSYREALRINPEYSSAYLNLGLALKDKGLTNQAVGAFENFLKYTPEPHSGNAEKVRGLVDSLKGTGAAKD